MTTNSLEPKNAIAVNLPSMAGNPWISYTAPATTFVGPFTITNNAGLLQIASAGVHGLTAANSNGKNTCIVIAGVELMTTIVSVDSTTKLTLDYPYSSPYGSLTSISMVLAGSYAIPTNLFIDLPANWLSPTGWCRLTTSLQESNDGSTKQFFWTIDDGVTYNHILYYYLTNSPNPIQVESFFYNFNNSRKLNNMAFSQISVINSVNCDTSKPNTMKFSFYVPTPDHFISINFNFFEIM